MPVTLARWEGCEVKAPPLQYQPAPHAPEGSARPALPQCWPAGGVLDDLNITKNNDWQHELK